MESKGERELLAIVFTDAVGSSSQTALDEDKSLSMLMADLDSIRNEAAARGGSVLKNTGDGLLISFKSAVDAIECALSIQKAFQGRPKGQGFQHKIGVHIGDVIKKDGDIYGAGVNTASRLVDQCAPGGICLSSTLYELTKQKSEIGQLKLKDFLLQNTEPPILAYRSFGEDSAGKEQTIQKGQEKPVARKKSHLVVAGVSLLLVAGLTAVFFQKMELTESSSDDGKLYGFEYRPGSAGGLKSTPNGAPILWTLGNNTDVNLELRWYDLEGRPKVSDNLNLELSRLGPGREFHGKTYQGHAFALFDAESQNMLGSFRFISGKRLNLVAEKENGQVTLGPKYLQKAKSGDAIAQACLAYAFWSGEIGVPQNNQAAAYWAKKSFDQGNSLGICVYAALTDAGAGVPQNSALALEYWKRGVDAGEPWAFSRVGEKYLWGRGGLSKDYQAAVPLLQQAVEKGQHLAMVNLGRCFENGWGVGIDLIKARDLYQKALGSDDPNVGKDARERLDEVQKQISEANAKETAQKEPVRPPNSK